MKLASHKMSSFKIIFILNRIETKQVLCKLRIKNTLRQLNFTSFYYDHMLLQG